MTKTFCDRCGAERPVEKVSLVKNYPSAPVVLHDPIDACQRCVDRLLREFQPQAKEA